jgi:peptidyl-prolyl cis-trans isomerase B (cyclophilin B)
VGFITNPKVFAVMGMIFAGGIVLGLVAGALNPTGTTDSGPPTQGNEAEDKPVDDGNAAATPEASVPTPTVKRFDSAPAMAIDGGRRYFATLKTEKGDIRIELLAAEAPESVNSFVFLAREGYYNNTPFMQLVANEDGSRFVTQAGDPTGTGLATPGYSIKKEPSSQPFAKGAVGMGGSSPTSNGGQFFISYGDYPALNGKYTIFGRVVSGQDVLDQLDLLEVSNRSRDSQSDKIISVVIDEA